MLALDPMNLGQFNQANREAMAVIQTDLAVPGDYNGNGTVDASDFVYWRKNINQTVTARTSADGDGDGNGDISQSDYNVWRQIVGNAPE